MAYLEQTVITAHETRHSVIGKSQRQQGSWEITMSVFNTVPKPLNDMAKATLGSVIGELYESARKH